METASTTSKWWGEFEVPRQARTADIKVGVANTENLGVRLAGAPVTAPS
ncbi:MAG TPA: hypothetical protein VI072_12255 [Polyangiaceae bacterium]